MGGIIKRELIYIWYYFEVQLSQIFWYWLIGMAVGSLISVFAKDKIHAAFGKINAKRLLKYPRARATAKIIICVRNSSEILCK